MVLIFLNYKRKNNNWKMIVHISINSNELT